MFPLTWTSLSAVVVASNTPSAPKATPTVDLGHGLWKATTNACILPSIGGLHHSSTSCTRNRTLRQLQEHSVCPASCGRSSMGSAPAPIGQPELLSMTARLALRVPKAPLDGRLKGFFSSTPVSSAKAVSPPSRMTRRPASTSLRLPPLWIRAPATIACFLMLSYPSVFTMKRSEIPQEELRSSSGSAGEVLHQAEGITRQSGRS